MDTSVHLSRNANIERWFPTWTAFFLKVKSLPLLLFKLSELEEGCCAFTKFVFLLYR